MLKTVHPVQPQILATINKNPVSSEEKPKVLSCQDREVKNMPKHPNMKVIEMNII